MIYRRLIALLSGCLFSAFTFAQSEKMADIAKIQKSKSYLSAMGNSTKSAQEALENANLLLTAEIEAWLAEENVKEKNKVAGFVAKSKDNVATIETQKGRLYRAFCYVKKKEILPYYDDENLITDKRALGKEENAVVHLEYVLPDTARNADTPNRQKLQKQTGKSNLTTKTADREADVTDGDIYALTSASKEKKRKNKQTAMVPEATVETVAETTTRTAAPISNEPSAHATMSSMVQGKADAVLEARLLKQTSTGSLKRMLNDLKAEGRLQEVGTESAMPSEGVVYAVVFDYNRIARERLRITDGKAVSLTSGSTPASLADVVDKYKSGSMVWFTIR